jgi:hypothetical protein
MARPTTKAALIELSNSNFQKLNDLIDSYSKEELNQEFPKQYMNRNIRDVLAHLHHWHTFMLDWYKAGMSGKKPDIPAKGYTWLTVPDLNRKIREQYSKTNLREVKKLLQQSFKKVQSLISQHSDAELFEKKKYPWTGTTSLGAYLISATSSHYDWALKLIKKALKKSK